MEGDFLLSQELLDKMPLCQVKLKNLKTGLPSIVEGGKQGPRKGTRNYVLRKKHPGDFMQNGLSCNEENCEKTMKYYSSYKR